MKQGAKQPELLNLKVGHPDFQVKSSLGNVILYHGKVIDLRSISRKDAEAIAADPYARYISRNIPPIRSSGTATDEKKAKP